MLWVFLIVFLVLSYRYGKNNNTGNIYISRHKSKLNNDLMYSKYLDWCYKRNQIPMDKDVYIKSIHEKESKLNNLIK